nr:hypothetical protein [Tanacetum cinerariifolium]
MATTIEQQVALDEALVPSAQRLRIGRNNFRLPSDIQSKESTLQVVYDVLRRSPFFRVFLVTADVPEIYMQEFWAIATVHQHSIRFKMDTRKHIVDLEVFREMLHISPRVPGQSFAELPFKEEIVEFLRFLGHSALIKRLTDSQIISSVNFMRALSQKKHRLCLSHLGRSCVSSGTQKSKEKQRDEEESFDPIPRTPEDGEDDGNGEEDQVSQDIEDSHVTLTPTHSDGQQESSSISSFVTSLLNLIIDPADLSEMELKKILIDKMEGNKSIQQSDEQRNLYKALVEAYDADKTIMDTYGESAILKRRRPSVGSDRRSKRRREGGEHASASTPSEPATGSAGMSTTGTQSRQLSASESAFAEEPVQTTCQMEEPSHPVFETGAKDLPIVQTSSHPEWFSQPRRPPTPDRDWNKTLLAAQGTAQSWISTLAKQTDDRSSFNELLDTPIDFSNFIIP